MLSHRYQCTICTYHCNSLSLSILGIAINSHPHSAAMPHQVLLRSVHMLLQGRSIYDLELERWALSPSTSARHLADTSIVFPIDLYNSVGPPGPMCIGGGKPGMRGIRHEGNEGNQACGQGQQRRGRQHHVQTGDRNSKPTRHLQSFSKTQLVCNCDPRSPYKNNPVPHTCMCANRPPTQQAPNSWPHPTSHIPPAYAEYTHPNNPDTQPPFNIHK